MMQGTPYVYQGEELGMTNVPFEKLEDYRDIESLNAYEEEVGRGSVTPDEMLHYLRCRSRDNARTPVQWDDGEHAGFTTGTPWIMVNPNYKEINAKEQLSRKDSVFYFYKELIRLRKEYDIIPYGTYQLLLPEDPDLFVYERKLGEERLLVICNFSEKELSYEVPEEFSAENAKLLIANYEDAKIAAHLTLRPYESLVLYQNC